MANVSHSLVERFFDTLGTAAQEVVNSSPSDLTIDAEIVSIVNIDGGEYKVNYQSNIFSAYSENPTITYKIGERVYILVPQGDMSRKKLIYGRSTYSNGASYSALDAMKNFYVDQGPNWAELYKSTMDLGICSCPGAEEGTLRDPARYYHFGFLRGTPSEEMKAHPHRVYEGVSIHTGGELETLDDQFNTWGKSNEYLKIQATFKTDFSGVHNTGRYSLQVNCLQLNPKYVADPTAPDYIEGEEQYKVVTYELGFSSFDGISPYNISQPSTQKGYFQVPLGGLVGIHSIGLVQNGEMQFEIPLTFDDKGLPRYNPADAERDTNNIFVSNIQVCFAKKVNLSDTLYYPYIEAPMGDSLYNATGTDKGRTSIQLIAHLLYGDTDIVEQEGCRIHWFRRKADVTESSSAGGVKDEFGKTYFDYGGAGWYPVEKIDEEQQSFTVDEIKLYKVEGNKLTINIQAVPWQWDYKAVMTYGVEETDEKGKKYIREITQNYAIQRVIRRDSDYDLELVPVDGELPGWYQVINHKDPGEERPWIGTWFEKGLDDSYNMIGDPFLEGPCNVLENPFSSWSMLLVQCYDPYKYEPSGSKTGTMSDTYEIGVLEKQLSADSDVPFVVDWEGDDFFKYDAQGQWKGERDPKEYVLTPVIRFAEGCACTYSIKVAAPDGSILGDYDYYRNASDRESDAFNCWKDKRFLVTQAYVDRYYGIHFTVSDTYDKEKAENNIFTITIFTDDQRQFTFTKQINFMKDGDMGTNGTEWNVKLRPCKWKASSKEGLFVEAYHDDHPYPLIVEPYTVAGSSYTHYQQNDISRLFLRPYVTRGGTPLEELDKEQAYFYRCSWDVRSPGSDSLDEAARLSSFLRLYHTSRTTSGSGSDIAARGKLFDVAEGGAFETGNDALSAQEEGSKKAEFEDIKVNEGMKIINPVDKTWTWKRYHGEPAINGLVAQTVYPLNPMKRYYTGDKKDWPAFVENNECYGAVEVCYFDNSNPEIGTGATLEQCHYRFVVKCTVEICQGNYDYGTHMIETASYARVVSTLVCYYPVDIYFNEDYVNVGTEATPVWQLNQITSFENFRRSIATNWPVTVKYDAIGYSPEHADEAMSFKVSGSLDNLLPFNLTPDTLTLAKANVEYDDELNEKSFDYKFRPVSHLSKQEGYHGAIRTELGDWPVISEYPVKKGSWYLRNIVMYYNRYGNADINGWDGQGLDTNEEEGTVFGVTFGAGWKGQFSNAFTGVLMGVDKNVKRSDYQEDLSKLDYPEEAEESHPYLTGLFGYQEGIQSFGLLENGTAFFGRADRGGRIIIDGSNGTIYGGANGSFTSPSIDDPMWNTLRINLVDLNHTKEGKLWTLDPDLQDGSIDTPIPEGETELQKASGYKVRNENGEPVNVNFNGQSYGFNQQLDEEGNYVDGGTNTIPAWYAKMWRNSYIQPWGAKPYWMLGYDDEKSGTKVTYEVEDLDWWLGDEVTVEDKNDIHNNRRINYFDSSWIAINTADIKAKYVTTGLVPPLPPDLDKYEKFPYNPPIGPDGITPKNPDGSTPLEDYPAIKERPELQERVKLLRELGVKLSLSSYGSQRASTTPAIEIGQHAPGLRPGLIAWRDYEALYESQRIPGDRNFLVTYDGTLWAMNGIFMGNVIGANIVGGRIQASQIGVGPPTEDVVDADDIFTFFGDGSRYYCQWYYLIPPVDGNTDLSIYPSMKTGYAMTFDENGMSSFGGELIGGSLDIGHFHVMGYKTIDRLKKLGKWVGSDEKDYNAELGHLIQTGKSDFIGITHFYGNVGLAPSTTGENDRTNSGSLVQVSGFTALGVIIPNLSDLKAHQYIDDFTTYSANRYYAPLTATYDSIGEGGSVEQSCVFAIESRGDNPICSDFDGTGIKGHFWPLHFFSKRRRDTTGVFVDSYVTMMNQFKSPAKNAGSVTGYATQYEGSNYFRVSPWGMEGQEFFVRNLFQPEENSVEPKPDEMSQEDASQHSYRGYIGAVSRAGYANVVPYAPDMGALGITTWNNNAIIFHSDDNTALRTRRATYITSNYQIDDIANDKTFTETYGDRDTMGNVMMHFGASSQGDNAGINASRGYGSWGVKSVGSYQALSVLKPDPAFSPCDYTTSPCALGNKYYYAYSPVRAWQDTGSHIGALFLLDPYRKEINDFNNNTTPNIDYDRPAIVLGLNTDGRGVGASELTNGGGIHIFCVPSGGSMLDDCRNTQWSETFWSENEIHSWAKNKNGIYSASLAEIGLATGGVHNTGGGVKGLQIGSTIKINGYTAEEQEGIYARFA